MRTANLNGYYLVLNQQNFSMKKIFYLIAALCIAQISSSQLYISPGASLHLSDNSQLTLQDIDLVNDGTLTSAPNGRVIFSGSGNNSISGASLTTFAQLEIAKTSGGLLTLQANIAVSNKTVFTSNLIELNNHNIDLGTTGFLENENENSRITGINGGKVLFTATLNAPSGVNPGNLGAVITSAQNLGSTNIQRGHKPQTNSSGGGSSIQRYFDISPTNNTGLNATLRINYFDAEKNTLNENAFLIFKSDDNTHWSNMGQSNRDAASNFVEQTGLNDFSRWTLSNISAALPVTGLQLSGMWENNTANLKWITLSEYRNHLFNIERKYSSDLDFITIGQKNSAYADGNSQTISTYNWRDAANTNSRSIQYRIKQEDLDGRYSYSNVISINPGSDAVFIKNINPSLSVKDQLYITTGNRSVNKMQVMIYDIKGSLIFNKQLNYESQWIALPQMSAGHYKMFIWSGANHWEGGFMKK